MSLQKPSPGKKSKITISDVAKHAAVAPSTVSHVINGTATISEETRQRVLSAISELQYSPNALARALRQNQSHIIGVVLQDISSEFYARCAASILESAREDGYVVLVCDAMFDNEIINESVHALVERRVDGLIFIGGGSDDHIINFVRSAHIPLVLGDRYYEGMPCVEFNNRQTVCNLVKALHSSGLSRFAYFGEPTSVQDNLAQRYEGFLDGLRACGMEADDAMIMLDSSLHHVKTSSAFDIFTKKFSQTPKEQRPEVILTSNDLIAYGVVSAAQRFGLNVPDDIAVVGFDDISISEFLSPPLTTVAQNQKELGVRCYEMLKGIMKKNKPVLHEVLEQNIIVRESALVKI